jgi:hypothetical protein
MNYYIYKSNLILYFYKSKMLNINLRKILYLNHKSDFPIVLYERFIILRIQREKNNLLI